MYLLYSQPANTKIHQNPFVQHVCEGVRTNIHGEAIKVLFFCGEGPRSICYGRTAALRLLVQPCDEDER